jgi:hypothetical protein
VPAPQRTARIEDEIWNPAQERAKAEGATLAALMRAAVRRYAGGHLTSSAEPASQAAAVIAITANGEPTPESPAPAPDAGSGTRPASACAAFPSTQPAPAPFKARATSARSRGPLPSSSAAAQPDFIPATTGLGHGGAGFTRPSPAARAGQAAQGRHGQQHARRHEHPQITSR